MQPRLFPVLLILVFCAPATLACQEKVAGIMFYNVENLFDTKDDPATLDEEFTPGGTRRWTYNRLRQKYSNISRVIINAGGWNLPVLVGLCEVENSRVLAGLLHETGLHGMGYRYVHHDSPDQRGIDVALLYKSDRFEVLSHYPLGVELGKGQRPTRDILYVKGIIDKRDTLHLFVNHWPSRRGGAASTMGNRLKAARVLRGAVDSIRGIDSSAMMVIMGDFNENPSSPVLKSTLQAGRLEDESWLINPALYVEEGKGTLKFRHAWYILDQVIVSRSLFNINSPVHMTNPRMRIVDLPFLKERDDATGGTRPFRTYRGFKYVGGYSDHYPVWIELITR